ncbi:hypothetical protein [uncultured Helicobacter sp.]|nr:hypothetical protein [uncultured Helicobacter sp.]
MPKEIYCYFADYMFIYNKDLQLESNKQTTATEYGFIKPKKPIETLNKDIRAKLIFCDANQRFFEAKLKQTKIEPITLLTKGSIIIKNSMRNYDGPCFKLGNNTYCDGDIITIFTIKLLIQVIDIGNNQVQYGLYYINNDNKPIYNAPIEFMNNFKMECPTPNLNIYSKDYQELQQKIQQVQDEREKKKKIKK